MKIEKKECDVLCVGGGIAGLMAAIRASELGADTIVAEKGHVLASGCGRAGNDHFSCYIPEACGPDMEKFIYESGLVQFGVLFAKIGPTMTRTWFEKSFHIVKLWDSWGIPMKYKGEWHFAGHALPGMHPPQLKYSGEMQKPVLVNKAKEVGAKIVNRAMVIDLLGGPEGVTGALAMDTREDKLIEFHAKAVILGTGWVNRMYPSMTPALMSNSQYPMTLTGDGRAMAYRLGADLTDIELFLRHVSIKYFTRAGQATWVGVYRYPDDKPLGPFIDKPDWKHGDVTPEIDKELIEKVWAAGKGPVYMDTRGMSDKDLDYMRYWLIHEGNISLLNYLDEEGVDLQKNAVEFMTTDPMHPGGHIYTNEKAETSVKGLYSAGDESVGSISAAAVFGWVSGENAANYAKEAGLTHNDHDREKRERLEGLIETLKERQQGPDWKDANIALQQTMYDYAGYIRSQPMLEAGLNHLRRLREKVDTTLTAGNRWELTRCLEVINLYDISELVMLGAMNRKETRGLHRRADYPLINPLLNDKLHYLKQVDGKPVFDWRQKPR